MPDTTYTVTIEESTRELTAREKLMAKDYGSAIKLDAECETHAVRFAPKDYVVLAVHNEKAKDNPDYMKFVIFDKEGKKYVTGSRSFWNAFVDIFSDMQGETEPWEIECYKADSKNYAGKKFLTCSII